MAGGQFVKIEVQGGRELRKRLRELGDKELDNELKSANKQAAAMVADQAKANTVPRQSGALARSIRPLGSKTKGQVKAGGKAGGTVNYAGVVHYGHPRQRREPQPFLHEAASEVWEEVYTAYRRNVERLGDKL